MTNASRPRTDRTMTEADFISTKAHCLETAQGEALKREHPPSELNFSLSDKIVHGRPDV